MGTRSQRLLAAASYLGVPFLGPGVPLVVWSIAPRGSFHRRHARQAFGFQITFLVIYLGCMARVVVGDGDGSDIVNVLAVGFVIQLPQAVLALLGARPLRIPPWRLLTD